MAVPVVAFTLYANSVPEPGPSGVMLAIVGWVAVAVGWAKACKRQVASRRGAAVSRWWSAVPLLAAGTALLCCTSLPTRARFEFSRPAMARVAWAALAGRYRPNPVPTPVGLLGPCLIEVHRGAVYFTVQPEDMNEQRHGYVYSPAGRPDDWYACESLGRPWYAWDKMYGPPHLGD